MALSGTRHPRLLLIADLDFAGDPERWIAGARSAAEAVPDGFPALLHLRVKGRSVAERAALYERAVAALRPMPAVVNGTTSEAVDSGAAGVHWPEIEIPRAPAPTRVGFVRSASVHGVAAARHAAVAGADYVLFGPVFDPGSKAGDGVGCEALAALCREVDSPVLAVGGIGAERVGPCLDAGAVGVAVISAVFGSDDPRRATVELVDAVNRHTEGEGR